MPRVGDVNLSPFEYADEVRKKVEKLSNRLYTYRYIWKRDDADALSVHVLTARLDQHEKFRTQLRIDEHVVSATAEYLSEIDINYLLLVEPVKAENKDKKEKKA